MVLRKNQISPTTTFKGFGYNANPPLAGDESSTFLLSAETPLSVGIKTTTTCLESAPFLWEV